MQGCPSKAELERMLLDELKSRDAASLDAHIVECARCQAELNRLTNDPTLHGEVHRESQPDELSNLLRRLRENPPVHQVRSEDASALPFDPDAPLPFSDFELGKKLGSGGIGVVHEATQKSLQKAVAVKLLTAVSQQYTDGAKRFIREACAAARLRHPNIVQVHGIGRTDEGGYFLVMDLVRGASLREHVKTHAFTSSGVAEVVATIADAIHYAHTRDVIHRDLKPGNVLISEDGAPLVTDFGIAKLLSSGESDLTQAGQPIGTPTFMAPEQADSKRGPISPATDVYGLGGILYFLLAGQPPFGDESGFQVMAKVASDASPPPPSSLRADIPADLEAICMKCLAKLPADRFATAGEVANALRGLSSESSHAPAIDQTPFVLQRIETQRIAILYKRNAAPDEQLLGWLEQHLRSAGHTVFVDRHLSIGVEWATEIERQIREADAVILLLSAGSIHSEMLAYEAQVASEAAQRRGRPKLLPVRVDYEAALPPELSKCVDRLQSFSWQGEQDNAGLAGELSAAFTAPTHSPDIRPWNLEPPLGAVPLDSKLYLVRPVDHDLEAAISRRDSIVLIRGARQMGKTSLLARGLRQARDSGSRVILTDFQKLNASDLESAQRLFLALGEWIADQLDLDVLPQDVWNERRGASVNFERYIRREVLAKSNEPIVWAIDEVDRLFSVPYSGEVFGLFRSWHNERALEPSGPWSNLTLAIAYATEAHLFITDINQSPFNVGVRLELQDFSLGQVSELNARYESPLGKPAEVSRFHQLLAGQPYLTNRGLYEMKSRNHNIAEFEDEAGREEGVFGDHLRRILVLLAGEPALCDVVRGVLRDQGCASAEDFYRLRSAGIFAGESTGQARLRCRLYADYLERHLE